MPGIIGRKIGMTSIFSAEGKALPCTMIEAGPCVVTQVKTQDRDGYDAIQLGFGSKKAKNTPNALKGHFKKSKTDPKSELVEFKNFSDLNLGDVVNVEIFEEGEFVELFYQKGVQQKDIAQLFKCSKSTISRLHLRILAKLRDRIREKMN